MGLVKVSEGSAGLEGLTGAVAVVRWRTFCLTESKRLPVSAAGTGWRAVIRFQTSANRLTNAATTSGTPTRQPSHGYVHQKQHQRQSNAQMPNVCDR